MNNTESLDLGYIPSKVIDVSENNNGINNGASTSFDGLYFNGIDNKIETENAIDFGADHWTVESWYYPIKSDGYGHIFTSSSNQGNFACKISTTSTSQKPTPYFYAGSDFRTDSSTTKGIELNEWSHISYIFDGNLKIYINGILEANISTTPSSIPSDMFTIQGGNNEFVEAKHRELRVWKEARTQTQIQENMYNMMTGKETNLIVYYPMVGSIPVVR